MFKIVRVKAPKNKLAPPLCEWDLKLHRDGRIESLEDETNDNDETEDVSFEPLND